MKAHLYILFGQYYCVKFITSSTSEHFCKVRDFSNPSINLLSKYHSGIFPFFLFTYGPVHEREGVFTMQ